MVIRNINMRHSDINLALKRKATKRFGHFNGISFDRGDAITSIVTLGPFH